ncbi:nif-specific transcriptional activator NifA [Roseospira visakhapatnamensis]|uniref:Nif-specific regulatory protein n=1 Tax=Roseospira visakhapatnamensis TaxID=390880 RepID=A0A7W6RED6_9PROT|nr:nif-specific transcriptional activator NifA [Roseospira visakhapatnamensis]MBB4266805.1 Nif-specific regulatory protein [Roseospira visakhapatnamensis]
MSVQTSVPLTSPPTVAATGLGRAGAGASAAALPMLTLYEISKLLSASLDRDATLRDVLNVLSSYLEMRRGAIALGDDDDSLALTAVTGQSLDGARRTEGGYPLTVAREVYRSNMPLVVGRMTADPRFAAYAPTAGGDAAPERVAFLCVPIRAGDAVLGTLSVERAGPGGVDDDLRVLAMVGNLIGQTVRLHRLVAADRQTLLADQARREKLARAERAVGGRTPRFREIIGRSPAMVGVLDQVRHVARTRAPVMLRGESGTGKEMIARAIHQVSPRADKPFVCVNCAALPDTLLESELFGHDKGAFTGAAGERKGRFEMADGGTLFLDEIGEISPAFQAKLLRVLQEGQFERLGSSRTRKVDVRMIAATNRNLEEAVSKGGFRADLYYRINVVTLVLPPLRDRREDIEPLARHFLDRFNEENGESLVFSPNALDLLRGCAFPGNVRELENCITRVATMVRGAVIGVEDFACREAGCLSSVLWRETEGSTQAIGGMGAVPAVRPRAPALASASGCGACDGGSSSCGSPPDQRGDDAPSAMATMTGGGASGRLPDRERLVLAMEKTGWVQAKAARLLGLTPRQVGYALRKHDIPIKRL